ncbi:MAG: TerB family tellurite resistance protein [Cytophagaceae bacterium]|jgi:uncharacterized tellurite resistance protein B-like protein|nr:TerB family tellurite resistance protein [Cytophagaceae bacterium]
MSLQNIHQAMGSLAYAIAKADGEIQKEEKLMIQRIAQQELEISDMNQEYIVTMFSTLEKENISLEEAYRYALDTLEANRHDFDFTDSVKEKCIRFLEKISVSFEGISREEQDVIDRFKKDMVKF